MFRRITVSFVGGWSAKHLLLAPSAICRSFASALTSPNLCTLPATELEPQWANALLRLARIDSGPRAAPKRGAIQKRKTITIAANCLSIPYLSQIHERPQHAYPNEWRYGATVSTRPFQS